MIGIGNQFGGPEHLDKNCLIRATLDRAMNIASDLRAANYDDGTKSWINPIFIVPGSISKPDFQGLKLGHFSRKKKGLVVMIAVPESVALGKAVPEFVVASLKDAAHVAAAHFKSKGISFPLDEAEQLIAGIEARLTATSIAVH
jgi:hypothetical protein